MAEKADGTIYINTEIGTEGFVAGGKDVEAAARRMAKTVSGIGETAKIALQKQTDTFVKQNQMLSQQEQKVAALRNRLKELSEAKVKTDEFKAIEKQIDSDTAKLNRLTQAQEEFLSAGGKEDSTVYKKRATQIEELQKSLKYAKSEQEDLLNSGDAYTTPDTSAVEQNLAAAELRLEQMHTALGTSYEALEQKVNSYTDALAKEKAEEEALQVKEVEAAMEAERLQAIADNAEISSQKIVDLTAELERLKARQADLQAAGLGLGYKEFDEAKVRIAELEQQLQEYAAALPEKKTKGFLGILEKVALAAKNAGAKILGMGKDAKSSSKNSNTLGLSFKNILKYGLGIRSLFTLFNKLRTAIVAGFQNLAQYSGETNQSISTLKSSLTQLKNSLATAFAPILSVVAPALTKMINLLSKASTYIRQFIAALTGKSTFTKAVAVQEDYAASLEDTASSAKNAQKYLSGLDEVTTFATSQESSAGAGGVSVDDMFETVQIEDDISSFAERVKQTLSDMFAPLKDAAQIYGPSIKNSLNLILQDIVSFGTRVGAATVNWFKDLDWSPLLSSVDQLLIKFEPLISIILDGLGWAYESVLLPIGKWTIEEGLPGLITLLGNAFDFVVAVLEALKPLGEWLWSNFLKDLGATVSNVVTGIMTTMSGLLEFLTGVFSGDWEKAMSGLQTMAEGLEQAVMAVFGFIQSNIMEPFDSWLQGVFSHDWTEEFGILGDILNSFMTSVKSIWNGIKTIFNGIVIFLRGTFSGNWKQAWQGIVQVFKGIWQTLVSIAKTPLNLIIGIVNGFVSAVVSGINAVISGLNSIHVSIPDWVPVLGGRSFGVNLGYVSTPKIPYLATGAVIPPNAPFMAVLGDQKQGTNIEAPLSTIEDAVENVLKRNGFAGSQGGSYQFTAQINRRTIFDEIITEAKLRQTNSGRNPFELA